MPTRPGSPAMQKDWDQERCEAFEIASASFHGLCMSMIRHFGPRIEPDGVTYRLWAPGAHVVDLIVDQERHRMTPRDGWHELKLTGHGPGALYRFRIDDDIEVPDPASRFQPQDVHGPSLVTDGAFEWTCTEWKGRSWHESVFLELHVGTFTPEGTFRAAIDRLAHIADTGFTAIELMPVADFAGRWNWGYDGVLPFAPDSVYGTPQDLKALIDAAHRHGLMVFLDVVYNHFGPEGNYLGRYAPAFFTKAQTPWGSAIDYRVPEVRRFAVENALYWLEDFHFDGLRLDAVHAIVEPGSLSLLHALSEAAGVLASETGRHIHLVLENDDNRAGLLDPTTDPPAGRYRAQWNDDYHHAWHVALTGEAAGYYRDYAEARSLLARALTEGFAYQGEPSAHRGGARRGEQSTHLLPTAFVNFLQNHDQIGNRARGERLAELAPPEALEAALAVTLLAPSPPLLFMGDEWGARQRFPFFCDFQGELADAVRQGRRKEFAEAYADFGDEVPDPLVKSTLAQARLEWSEITKTPYRERLALVRRLLEARRRWIVPLLPLLKAGDAAATWQDDRLDAHWGLSGGRRLRLAANLSGRPQAPAAASGTVIWGDGDHTLAPWSVRVTLDAP